MASSSIPLRWISEKAAASRSAATSSSSAVINSLLGLNNNTFGRVADRRLIGTMTMAGISSDESSLICHPSPSSTLPSRISPWLMLPPEFQQGSSNGTTTSMVYKFYDLKENKVVGLNKRGTSSEFDDQEQPHDGAEVVGSSQGWLALYDPRNCDLYLSNPLSRRHVKLPPMSTLPNLGESSLAVKLIISSSPDQDRCRAMMNYGPEDRLAFCCPGGKWTSIGERFYVFEDGHRAASSYEDFVYSSSHDLFFSITKYHTLEAWDLRDPSSQRVIPMEVTVDEEDNFPYPCRSEEERELKEIYCQHNQHLVVAEPSGDLYLILRHFMDYVAPDGSYVDHGDEGSDECPHKTITFDVYKIEFDPKDTSHGQLRYMEKGSLDGLSMFVGHNHSFAVKPSQGEFPELKPNSIYFTDSRYDSQSRHDVGIFNYEDGTISPCYYPCDARSLKRIPRPGPMWFTPSSV